jgi:hypothetical protein
MELFLPIGLIVFCLATAKIEPKPPTKLNPSFYHDETAFCQRYNRILAKGRGE